MQPILELHGEIRLVLPQSEESKAAMAYLGKWMGTGTPMWTKDQMHPSEVAYQIRHTPGSLGFLRLQDAIFYQLPHAKLLDNTSAPAIPILLKLPRRQQFCTSVQMVPLFFLFYSSLFGWATNITIGFVF